MTAGRRAGGPAGTWYGLVFLQLAGCAAPEASKLDVSARLTPGDSLFGAIEVRGLPGSVLGNPGPDAFTVAAVPVVDSGSAVPPLAGRYVVDGETIRFVPRYRPSGGLMLRVVVPADSPVTRFFQLPADHAPESRTTVTGIYPSADTIPANHLRWYIEFSAPMREGEAEQHVHLLDGNGVPVEDAFLIVSEELWDPARRRLTVLFDPGRVKQGVRQNLEIGAPLVAGRDYVFRVDPDWRDGRGAALAEGHEKRFHVVAANRAGLDAAGWRIEAPKMGTREPVAIDFGRPLDKALAERLVVVMQAGGMVAGQVSLASGEEVWRFTPTEPWSDREYEVRVSPLLEDPAGNRVGHNFDRDRAEGEWLEGEAGQAVTLRFRPLLYSSARAR